MLPQNWLIKVTNSVFGPLESNFLRMFYQLHLSWSSWWVENLAPEGFWTKPSYSALKVCDDGVIFHLWLLSFWNFRVIWCFEHNRTWGLSLFWNVVPHHWVIGAECFETTWWLSQHVRHQSPSVLEPHTMDRRAAALLHKSANSLNSTFQKLDVIPFSSEKDSEPCL